MLWQISHLYFHCSLERFWIVCRMFCFSFWQNSSYLFLYISFLLHLLLTGFRLIYFPIFLVVYILRDQYGYRFRVYTLEEFVLLCVKLLGATWHVVRGEVFLVCQSFDCKVCLTTNLERFFWGILNFSTTSCEEIHILTGAWVFQHRRLSISSKVIFI